MGDANLVILVGRLEKNLVRMMPTYRFDFSHWLGFDAEIRDVSEVTRLPKISVKVLPSCVDYSYHGMYEIYTCTVPGTVQVRRELAWVWHSSFLHLCAFLNGTSRGIIDGVKEVSLSKLKCRDNFEKLSGS